MLEIRTRGRRMVGAGKTTELWWPPFFLSFVWLFLLSYWRLVCFSPSFCLFLSLFFFYFSFFFLFKRMFFCSNDRSNFGMNERRREKILKVNEKWVDGSFQFVLISRHLVQRGAKGQVYPLNLFSAHLKVSVNKKMIGVDCSINKLHFVAHYLPLPIRTYYWI